MLFGLASTSAEALRNYLIKPLLDEVVLPQQVKHQELSKKSIRSIFDTLKAEKEKAQSQAPETSDKKSVRAEKRGLSRELREKLFDILTKALILVIIAPIAMFGKDYLVEFVLGRVRADVQRALCRKLLALPLSFHASTTRGDLLSRTTNDVTKSYLAMQVFFGDLIPSALTTITYVGVLFWISWQLSLVVLITGPLMISVVGFFGRRIRRAAKRRQETVGDLTQRLNEILSGIKVIQAFRGEEREAESFANTTWKLFKREMKVTKNRILSHSVVNMISNTIAIAIVMLGALLVGRAQWGLTLGSLAFFLATLRGTYQPIKLMTKGWNQLMDSLSCSERFFELLDSPLTIADAPDAKPMLGLNEAIRYKDVHFSYGIEPVLQGIELEVIPGEVVALVGRTGAGKTTLVDLLLRFYDPTAGSIQIDGIDLRNLQRNSLLDHIAVVTQQSFLFQGTIRENIRYGNPKATDEEVLQAARAAHVDEFAIRLAKGYDTDVGEEGVQLSGGQRQRITIARALLKNPAILIFDEATSSLDAQSERLVQEAIETLLHGRTVFVIAHRFSTIRHADKTVVMEDGRITQIGTHADLSEQAGLYRDLLSLQNGEA